MIHDLLYVTLKIVPSQGALIANRQIADYAIAAIAISQVATSRVAGV
jgi:hypothetical protein